MRDTFQPYIAIYKKIFFIFIAYYFITSANAVDSQDAEFYQEKIEQNVDINEAMRRGIEFQPRLAIENANLEKTEILNRIEQYNWHPSIQLNITRRLDSDTDDRASASSEIVKSINLTATQNLNFLKQKLKRRISEKAVGIGFLEREGQVNNVAKGVAILYLEALRFRQLHQAAVKRQELYQELEVIIAKRKALGVVSELEVTRVEVSIKRGKAEESFLQRRLQDSLSILSDNIGIKKIDSSYLTLPDIRNPRNISSMFDDMMKNNPILRAIEEKLYLAELNYKNSKWEKNPSVNLSLSQDYKIYREENSSGGRTGENRILEVKVSMPIWDGFQRKGNVSIAAAEIEASKARIRDYKLTIITQHNEQSGTFKAALDEYYYASLAKKEAEKLLELQRINFRESDEASVTEIISGIAEWSTSSQREVNSLIDALQAQYEIFSLTNTLIQ